MVSSNGVILHAHITEHLLRMLSLMLAYPFSMHLIANLLLNKPPRRVNGFDETSYEISPDKASSVGFHQNGDMLAPLPKHPDKYLNPDHESVCSPRTNELDNQESKLDNSCQCLSYDTYNISDKMLSHQKESSMKKKK